MWFRWRSNIYFQDGPYWMSWFHHMNKSEPIWWPNVPWCKISVVVVDSLFVGFCVRFLLFNAVPSVCSSFAIIMLKKKDGCLTLIVILLSCGCTCSVSLPFWVVCSASWTYFWELDPDNVVCLWVFYSLYYIAHKSYQRKIHRNNWAIF